MTNEEILFTIEALVNKEIDKVGRDVMLTDYARGAALASINNLLVAITEAFPAPVEPPQE